MPDRFIARQPIFDRRLKIFAYELLFRAGPENRFRPGQSVADDVVVNSTMLFDMQTLVGHAMAFFNVDEGALRREVPKLLSPKKVVLEILETVRPTPELIEICSSLASDQYILALDDFVDEPKWEPLIPYVQFLKVDFRSADHDLRAKIADRYLSRGIHLLAEKVETEAELQEAKSLGYTYYQGYFFCEPSMLSGRDIPTNRPVCLRLLQAASAAELDYPAIEDLFRQDPSLTYRLLRFLNSPALAFRAEIHNVRQAITLLGEREFRRWVAIVTLVTMAESKTPELIKTALTRAYFCEELSAPLRLSQNASDLFLMGLLSVADALLDRPMKQVLADLSLSPEIRGALTGTDGPFSDAVKITKAYEAGDWPALSSIASKIGYAESEVPERFLSASSRASALCP
jgi:EAL and modified HD-GYP domain-containing signal transduction protein